MPCPNIFEKYELIHGACWRINNDMRGNNVLDVIISNKSLYIIQKITLISSYSQPVFICLRINNIPKMYIIKWLCYKSC